MRASCWLPALLFACFGSLPASGQDLVRFSQLGVSFDYPKDWKTSTETAYSVTSITVKNNQGSQLALHLHPAGTNPVGARIQLERSLQQANEGKLVDGSEQTAKRKFSVGEQEGVTLAFKGEGAQVVTHELYAFALNTKKKQVCLVHFQSAAADTAAAEKVFALIAQSLGEEGAKPGSKPAPATPPFQLMVPVPEGWEIKPARKDAKLWADRDYTFLQLPKDVEGGFLVMRNVEEGKYWLPPERVAIVRGCTVYAVLRTRYLGNVMIDSSIFKQLGRDGWSEVAGPASTSNPPGENWGWRVIKRPLNQGDEFPALKGMTWGQPVVFVFK